MRSVYFGARLHLGVNSDLAFSLPQSYCSNPLCSPTAPSSEGAEAATAASRRIAKACAAVKPAVGGLPSSVTVQCQSTAPRRLPQGEGKEPRRLCVTSLSKCAATRGTPKYFAAKRQNISHAQSAYFTAPQALFHTAAKPPYITEIKKSRC